jgi:hypothetical protein
MGNDHILAVDNQGFSEDYKRFYFSDIQAIVTRKTKRGAVWNIIFTGLIALSLTGALFQDNTSVRLFFWAFAGVFLVFLAINLLRGPTCACNIVTAVQEDLLPSLNRLRTAQKVIDILRETIENFQGQLTPEEVIARANEATNRPQPPVSNMRQSSDRQKPVRHYDGTMHMAAFVLMLANGIALSIGFLHHTRAMAIASSISGAAYFIFIIISLVKQYESDIPGAVRRITWSSLVFICISSFVSYIMMMGFAMRDTLRQPKEMMTQWDMFLAMLDISPQDSSFVMAIYGFAAACPLILGTLGLIRVMNHRTASKTMRFHDPKRTGNPGT